MPRGLGGSSYGKPVTLGSVALYVALHLALVGRIGNATGILSVVPVLVAAAFYGLKGGMAAELPVDHILERKKGFEPSTSSLARRRRAVNQALAGAFLRRGTPLVASST